MAQRRKQEIRRKDDGNPINGKPLTEERYTQLSENIRKLADSRYYLSKDAKNVLKDIEGAGTAAVRPLAELLTSPYSNVRREALRVLGNIGQAHPEIAETPDLIPQITKRFYSKGVEKKVAANALWKIGLDKTDRKTRSDCMLYLKKFEDIGKLGDGALPALAMGLESDIETIRTNAARAVHKLKLSDEDFSRLMDLIYPDKRQGLDEESAKALCIIPDKRAVPLIIEASESQKWNIRRRAVESLVHQCQLAPEDNELIESIIPTLFRSLKDGNANVRKEAAAGFVVIAHTPVSDFKSKRWRISPFCSSHKKGGEVRDFKALRESMSDLNEALDDRNADVRGLTARAIGKLRYEEALPHLIRMLEDRDCYVRREAIEAIGLMGKEPEGRFLVAEICRKDQSRQEISDLAKAIRNIGGVDISRINDALAKSEPGNGEVDSVRREELVDVLGIIADPSSIGVLLEQFKYKEQMWFFSPQRALAEIDDPSVVDAFIKALNDDDAMVRGRAISGIGCLHKKKHFQRVDALFEALQDAKDRHSLVGAINRIVDSYEDIDDLHLFMVKYDEYVEKNGLAIFKSGTASHMETIAGTAMRRERILTGRGEAGDFASKSVDELRIGCRAANALQNQNIRYIGEVMDLGSSGLRKVKGVGRKTAAEIMDAVNEMKH